MINQFEQDDIYVEMTFLRTLEIYGYTISQCLSKSAKNLPARP
jgi:hypothetical protein